MHFSGKTYLPRAPSGEIRLVLSINPEIREIGDFEGIVPGKTPQNP
jgi:hypothetical protein